MGHCRPGAVLGSGVVGANAASVALGMGVHVLLVAKRLERARYLTQILHGNLETVASTPESVAEAVRNADLVIGAVLIPGGLAPKVVTREMVRSIRPGSVIVDVSVDQGGCVETSRPTTHSNPVFSADRVIHYCVANIPGSVPRTATEALCNATLPYISKIAESGVAEAMRQDPVRAKGLNTHEREVTHEALARDLGLPVKTFPSQS